MKIKTSDAGLADPKDPDTCTVFKLFSMIEKPGPVSEMRAAYVKGGLGYGEAKAQLFDALCSTFKEQREEYQRLSARPLLVEDMLNAGEAEAAKTAKEKMGMVREKLGF